MAIAGLETILLAVVFVLDLLQLEHGLPAFTLRVATIGPANQIHDVGVPGSVLIVPLTVLFYSVQPFLIPGLSIGAIAGQFTNQTPL